MTYTIAKIAAVLGDDIITTTTSVHPYKLPEEQKVTMAAEDIHKH